jgi:predicted MFS family arabinose efflux permease
MERDPGGFPPLPWRRRLRSSLSAATALRSVLMGRPDVMPIALASLVARLPRGMASLAIILLVHEATGSYAAAGLAGGAMSIGDAAISPLQGRLIDRFGRRLVLLPSATCYLFALLALVLAARANWPDSALVLFAAAGGMAFPPVSATMKTLWPHLVENRRDLRAAYALESLIQQTFFLIGPLLVAALVAFASPAAAVVATGLLGFAGTAAFVRLAGRKPLMRKPIANTGRALAAHGVGAIVAIASLQAIVLGALYVALPAFAQHHGNAAAAGVLLALLNVGAIAGGLVGAGQSKSDAAVEQYVRLCLLLGLSQLAPLLAASVAQMGVVVILAGLFIAPTAAASYVLIDLVSIDGTRTEAFTWMSTAVAAGTAVGAALGGAIVEQVGITATLAFAGASSLGSAAVALVSGRLLHRLPTYD